MNLATGLVYASCSDVGSIKESNSDYETQTSVEPVTTETLHQIEHADSEHNHNT